MLFAIRLIACALLAVLAWCDVRSRRLPGPLVAALVALYFAAALAAHAAVASVLVHHVAVAVAAFAVGTALFACGALGGGDVKLAAAVFLWAGSTLALPALLLIALAGLAVALLALAASGLVRLAPSSPFGRAARPWSAKRGVPYGVALAAGGAVVILGPVLAHGPHT
ncbi:peptidase A24A prepilin type IV [Burkholderia sp. WAC0059]|uniref:prepilin peptidase n=1 Tax=Burkholderia sp. WAC0059 TaxID=2066022 RepID=UPI000C7EE837|nr:prepilin peptidase [Burkholderia sp. WAC0059]PLZ03376.1 peptidase A24A prepilin type IV [Burkholderia sp. WAC0059]